MLSKIYHFLDEKKSSKYFLFYYRFFKIFINLYYPIFIHFSRRTGLSNTSNIVISFTSFPLRIKKVHLVVESLLRQKTMPNKILLYLSLKQIKGFDKLPKSLKKLSKLGLLEIRFVEEDFKSHKKYYYSFSEYKTKNIITVDDDIFYPEDFVDIFYNASKKFKNSVLSNRAYKITFNNNNIDLYKNWSLTNVPLDTPLFGIVPIGCAGIYYPANCMNNKLLLDYKKFLTLCPKADDLWLKFNSVNNNVKSIKLSNYVNFVFVDIIFKNNKKLCDENVVNSQNDVQLKSLINEYPSFVDIIFEENQNV